MIRRNVNNLIIPLDREKVIELIQELTKNLAGNPRQEKQDLVIEFTEDSPWYYPQDMD